MSREIECDSCGASIGPNDDYLVISEMLRQSDGEPESKPAGYTVCRKETCLSTLSI